MKAKSLLFTIGVAVTFVCSSPLSLWAQGTSSQSASSSGPSASQGSATIENEMIAYEVLRQMARQIAERVKTNCKCSTVLLPDPNLQSEIVTAKAFDVSVQALVDAYAAVGGQGAPAIHIEAFAPTLSDAASLLTAIKSSAAYSNQNFQPTTQSMITLMSDALKGKVAVRTANLPGDVDFGVRAVQKTIGEIEQAQKDAKGRIKQKQTVTALSSGTIGLDVAMEALKDSLRQKKANINEIYRYAKVCRVSNVIRPYMEAL